MSDESKEDEVQHLSQQHGLIKTTAYIQGESKKQSGNARRVAAHRQRKKESGLTPIDLPVAVVEEIRAAGSFEAWAEKKMVKPLTPERLAELKKKLLLAEKVLGLPGWIRWILDL